jgi:hypothetical protein
MAERKAKNEATQEKPNAITDINALPRVAQALRYRRLGYTYDEIAHMCGYPHASNARKAIKQAESRIIRDEARALVNRQLDMIDMALSHAVMKKIESGDLWAVDRLVPLLRRQAELLGLDAPPNSPVTNTTVYEEMPEGA